MKPQNAETTALQAPIATAEDFKNALLKVRDSNLPDSHLAMLRAQCREPGGLITATQLSVAAEYQNFNAANLQYGTLAMNVAVQLGFEPQKRADGTPRWWTTLSYCNDDSSDPATGHFQFVMRPELVAALKEMRWA